MWTYERIRAIEKLCFGLTGSRLSYFHSSTIGLDRQETSRGTSATEVRVRIERHVKFTTRKQRVLTSTSEKRLEQLEKAARLLNIYGINDTSTSRYHCALGGKRQGIQTETFDAETEVTRGFHVEEETRRSDKIVGRTKNENALISPEKPSYTCHNHHERQHEH